MSSVTSPWTDPSPLNNNAFSDSAHDEHPRLATDGIGNWIVLWESVEDINGAGTDRDILVAHSNDDGFSWTDPTILSPDSATENRGDAFPAIAVDDRGNWVTVWQSGTLAGDQDILGSLLILPDCNRNGIGDHLELADDPSKDCDANGILDECEPDADGDGVIDACDNCPAAANTDQIDSDGDAIGDACIPLASIPDVAIVQSLTLPAASTSADRPSVPRQIRVLPFTSRWAPDTNGA